MNSTRRNFLKNSTQLAAGMSLASIPGASLFASSKERSPGLHSANNIVRVGLIGCNSMGWSNLTSMLIHDNVACIALCDIDRNVLDYRAAELEKQTGTKPDLYNDYRNLLNDKNIDAVIIGTPDHWHCLQMIHACEAGKDVYVEKPIANTIEECNLMVNAKNKYNKIVQVGQWQRSDPHWISALDYLRSGELGKIRTAKSWAFVSYGRDLTVKPDESVPTGVDYEMWLGPADKKPFNPNRFHGNFRYFWDYGGGLMTDWGVHMIDMVLAGLNLDVPVSASSVGGKYGFPESPAETPDTMQTLYQFDNFSMLWEQSFGTGIGPYNHQYGEPGIAFIGNKGTLFINRNKWEVYPEIEGGKFLTEPIPVQTSSSNGLNHHTLNFLNCVKSRQQPNCTIEMGRNAAVTAQLGNISYRTGSEVFWNERKNNFISNLKAEELAKAKYNTPWKLPIV